MSRISELPSAQPITGVELVPIVQDGETRQAPAAAFSNASTPSITSTTWIAAPGLSAPPLVRTIILSNPNSGGC